MSHPRLLLADEDHTLRVFLADNLTADDYHVDTAEDHNHAVHRLRTTTPDLITDDVNGANLALLTGSATPAAACVRPRLIRQ